MAPVRDPLDVAYIALGSNVGDRASHLVLARDAIAQFPASRVIGASAVEETAPLGPIQQPHYLNQMLAVETRLSPYALLGRLRVLERAAGRERRERWGPRTLDLDLVLFERASVASESLTVPHPELARRQFWIRELEELRVRD